MLSLSCWAGLNKSRFNCFPFICSCWAVGPNLNQLILTIAKIIPHPFLAVVKDTVKVAFFFCVRGRPPFTVGVDCIRRGLLYAEGDRGSAEGEVR